MFARSAAPPSRPTAIAGPDTAQNSLTGGCATSGPVPTTETRQKRDETLRLVRREILALDLREARRRHKPTFSIAAELRRLTHQSMKF